MHACKSLLTHEQALKILVAALDLLKQPGLEKVELQRLRILVDAVHVYDSVLEKFEGWVQIEERLLEMNKKISQADRKRLIKLFNQMARYEFEHLRRQIESRESMRKKIDLEILHVLGFKRNESKRLLNILYDALEKEFEALDNLSSRSNS